MIDMFLTSTIITGILLACLGYDFESLGKADSGNCSSLLEDRLVRYQRENLRNRILVLCSCILVCIMIIAMSVAAIAFVGSHMKA